ncbi:MAG: MBL fold metallo-hydrolase, partial [Chloroflexi bacterium]
MRATNPCTRPISRVQRNGNPSRCCTGFREGGAKMSQVRVRMYRTGGIGDCFLLSFQDGNGPHMLIDCGILKGTPDGAEGVRKAIRNVAEVTGGKLDILVVTHEHWDHVSGFLHAREEFEQRLKIGEVWLAWTEDPGNDLAGRLRGQKENAKKAVAAASLRLRGLLGAKGDENDSLAALERLGLFYTDDTESSVVLGLAASAPSPGAEDAASPAETPTPFTTAGAMDWARQKTGGRVRYLSPGKETVSIPGAEGVRVFVLGPPQDEAWIKKDKPSKRSPEVYSLGLGNDQGFMIALEAQPGAEEDRPFDYSFGMPVDEAQKPEQGQGQAPEQEQARILEKVFYQQTY